MIAQNHFLVELEDRSPDVQSMVRAYEGTQAVPIEAKDVNGVMHSVRLMKGKVVMMWFWNNDCPNCFEQIDAFNKLTQKYPDDLAFISFSNNTKEEILEFVKTRPVEFPIIPNSEMLSEGPYGGDLGYPKIFIIDKKGMVKWVVPEIEMRADFDTFNFFETLHVSLTKS